MRRFLSAALALGFVSSAVAQSLPARDARMPAASTTAADASRTASRPNCLEQTGSRITATSNARARKAGKDGTECVGANGRSYSRDDLRNTGEANSVDALRKLDPSIR